MLDVFTVREYAMWSSISSISIHSCRKLTLERHLRVAIERRSLGRVLLIRNGITIKFLNSHFRPSSLCNYFFLFFVCIDANKMIKQLKDIECHAMCVLLCYLTFIKFPSIFHTHGRGMELHKKFSDDRLSQAEKGGHGRGWVDEFLLLTSTISINLCIILVN